MSSANRGPTPRGNRKRSRTNGEGSSVAPSSPIAMASSPPAFDVAHGVDDEDDDMVDDEPEIQDDLDEMDELAEDDVDLFREGFEQDYRDKDGNDETQKDFFALVPGSESRAEHVSIID